MSMLEQWDLWFPDAGATGLSFARCRVDARDTAGPVLVHAAPPRLSVTVRDESGAVIAEGRRLDRRAPGPISVLTRAGATVTLEDRWPGPEDLGRVVILPGGEAGILVEWWHAEDHTEWRWRVEFYNHR
jgi:hypothetical protein